MRHERQAAILKLIKEKDIETQFELSDELRNLRFDVTQATVSRDIKDLRLVKVQGANGKYKYSQPTQSTDENIYDKLDIIFKNSLVSIDYALNNVVLKTLPGMAQAAAAAIDATMWNDVLGTIAGDDTVLIVVKSEEAARRFVYDIRNMLDK
ncbi:MAG: arginine repressor [Clostridiaceae bacterium]|nr:arginine repressor [Clostridiaceae bacterium]